jgi:two-component sensor histidine kinase
LLQADGATFVLRDGDHCYYAEEDALSPLWKGRRFPMSACISGWCMTHREAAAISDIYQDSRIPADVYRPTFVRSLAMAPVGRNQPVAALGAYWSERRQPGPGELQCLLAIADATAMALQGVRLRQAGPPEPRRAPAARMARPSERGAAPVRRPLWGVLGRLHEGFRHNSPAAYAFAVASVVVAVLLREGFRMTGVHGLVIYSTFYPAAALTILVAGRRAGTLALLLGGFAAYWLFMPPAYQFAPLSMADALNLTLYGLSGGLILIIIDWYQRSLARMVQEDARHFTLAREQGHRVRNAMSVAQAIVRQSLKDLPERARIINQRLRTGLAEIDIEGSIAKTPVGLRALLLDELEPYDLARFTLEGEDEGPLPPEPHKILALAAHELATNALKYGALCLPEGRVTVAWRIVDGRMLINWCESGGPPVKAPQKRGYGTIMLRRLVEAAGGSMLVEFAPSGVMVELSLPHPSADPAKPARL